MKTRDDKAKARRLPAGALEAAAEALRVLAHPARLRLVEALDLGGPAPVHALMAGVGLRQAAVSDHLNKMRRAGLIRASRRGREVWYTLCDPRAITLLNCLRKNGESP